MHYLRKGAGRRSFKLRFGDKISFWKIINKIQRDRVNVISVPLLVCLSFYHWIWACKICKQKLCFIYFHFFEKSRKQVMLIQSRIIDVHWFRCEHDQADDREAQNWIVFIFYETTNLIVISICIWLLSFQFKNPYFFKSRIMLCAEIFKMILFDYKLNSI